MVVTFPLCGVAQQWDWVNRFPGGSSSGVDLGIDESGNSFVAGVFAGSDETIIGTNHFLSRGGNDVFFARLDTNGSVAWAIATGSAEEDSVRRIVVTATGTVFVCGRFAVDPSLLATPSAGDPITNVCLARIDDGRFTWIETSPPGVNINAIAVTNGILYAVGNSNRVFVRMYDLAGQGQGGFTVGNSPMDAIDIAPGADGDVYVATRFVQTADVGGTNYTSDYFYGYLTIQLNATGAVQWAWNSGSFTFGNPIVSIAPAANGGVVSVAYWNTGLPQGYTMVVKHSRDGTLQWRTDRTGGFKSIFTPSRAVVDERGCVHVIGTAFERMQWGYYRNQIYVWIFSPDGEFLSGQLIYSRQQGADDTGKSIAVAASGETFITGSLNGTPNFNGEPLGDGPVGPGNAFVARRATVIPVLTQTVSGASITLSWPRTAMPSTLQRSETLLPDSWTNVPGSPNSITNGATITLPMDAALGFFRLRMTNDVIEQPPDPSRFYLSFLGSAVAFPLGTQPAFVTASNTVNTLIAEATVFDPDYDASNFDWYINGASVTNGTSVRTVWVHESTDEPYPWSYGTLSNTSPGYFVGTNTLTVVASDRTYSVTNSLTFRVVSVVSALDELIAAVEAVTTVSEGARLTEPLQLARAAALLDDRSGVATHVQEFKDILPTSAELSDMQRSTFGSAATAIQNAVAN